jgi:hypothetical protein
MQLTSVATSVLGVPFPSLKDTTNVQTENAIWKIEGTIPADLFPCLKWCDVLCAINNVLQKAGDIKNIHSCAGLCLPLLQLVTTSAQAGDSDLPSTIVSKKE